MNATKTKEYEDSFVSKSENEGFAFKPNKAFF